MPKSPIASIRRALLLAACNFVLSSCGDTETNVSPANHQPGDAAVVQTALPGTELSFEVNEARRTLVDLDDMQVYDVDSGIDFGGWDLAFVGWEVFTNSGPSGAGSGAAFGPLSAETFLFDTSPQVPFTRGDATGGAFTDWYAYDGSTHQLWSKYRVYGVRVGERLFKVQILGYYGDVQGAPMSAMYQLRYAEVTESGTGAVKTLSNLDGSAGYPKVTPDSKSGCVNLGSGKVLRLTPGEALASREWDLCFRREEISVNGEEGGPGEVSAVDLGAVLEGESLAEIKRLTAESQFDGFKAVAYPELTDPELDYRGDHVFSQFGTRWYEGKGENAKPAEFTWLVINSAGEQHYSLLFTAIEGNAQAAGKVTIRARRLRGP